MKFENPIGVFLTSPSTGAPRPAGTASGTRGLLRIGDRPERARADTDQRTVFIVADTLLQADRAARDLGLATGEWRALVGAEDLWWHRPQRGAHVIDAGADSGRARRIRAALG